MLLDNLLGKSSSDCPGSFRSIGYFLFLRDQLHLVIVLIVSSGTETTTICLSLILCLVIPSGTTQMKVPISFFLFFFFLLSFFFFFATLFAPHNGCGKVDSLTLYTYVYVYYRKSIAIWRLFWALSLKLLGFKTTSRLKRTQQCRT